VDHEVDRDVTGSDVTSPEVTSRHRNRKW